MSWIQSFIWFFLFQFYKKYYGIKVAKTLAEKEKIFKFRCEIYNKELNYYFSAKENYAGMQFDEYDLRDETIILYTGDIDNITGTVRMAIWDKDKVPTRIKENYSLTPQMLVNFRTVGEIRFLEVRKDMRKTFLGLTLMSYLYQAACEQAPVTPEVVFSDCMPGLLSSYLKVGCFAYTDKMIHRVFGILLIPLVIVSFDLNYLKNNKCITYHVVKHCYQIYKKKMRLLGINIMDRDLANTLPNLNLHPDKIEMIKYQKNISHNELEKPYQFILSHVKNPLVLTVEENTIIIKKDIIDYEMFILLEGRLGIFINNALLAELHPGAIFGEMSLFNEKHQRYNDVISLSKARILLLKRNFLTNLEKKNPKVANQLLHILCINLLFKLANANKQLYKLGKNK